MITPLTEEERRRLVLAGLIMVSGSERAAPLRAVGFCPSGDIPEGSTSQRPPRRQGVYSAYEISDDLRDRVCGRVAQAFGLATRQLLGPRRTERVALARHVAMAILFEEHEFSCTEVARVFGRTHGAVLYAVRVVERERISGTPRLRAKLESIFTSPTLITDN